MALNIHVRAAVSTQSFRMVCFVQGKVKKWLIELPLPLILIKIYSFEYTIILNPSFAQAENKVRLLMTTNGVVRAENYVSN